MKTIHNKKVADLLNSWLDKNHTSIKKAAEKLNVAQTALWRQLKGIDPIPMNRLQEIQVDFKIAPEDTLSLIGSNSIFTAEDLYTIPLQPVYQPRNRRRKRAFDIISALFLVILIPVDVWLVDNKGGFVRNLFAVLSGRKSWVGVHSNAFASGTPIVGVLYPADAYPNNAFSDKMVSRLEDIYIRNYLVHNDLTIVAKGFAKLGNQSL